MNDRVLKISNQEILFPAPVQETLKHDGVVVVRVYPSSDELAEYPRSKLNRNVYGYDGSGRYLWEIQEAPEGGVDQDKAYMDISVRDGKLVAGNWIGVDYVVDMRSGTVSRENKLARPW